MAEPLDTLEFMKKEFQRAGISYEIKKGDIAIPCPFACEKSPDYSKKKLQIHFNGAPIHCWVCKKRGTYNTVAEKLGLSLLPLSVINSASTVERQVESLAPNLQLLKHPYLPVGLSAFDRDWRGVPRDFLVRNYTSSLYFDTVLNEYRILWPVSFNGRLQGWVSAYLEEGSKMRYVNGPSGIFRTKFALFGIETPVVSDSKTIVLCEGPFDSIRLQYEGIPAVGIFGTSNWDMHKGTMLHQRMGSKTERVILAFDGDEAGWECTRRVYADIKNKFSVVDIFDVPEKCDPGNMSDSFIQTLMDKVYG